VALNGEFRKIYAHRRAALLAAAGPVIFVDGDKLVLLRGRERAEVDAIPAIYHHLKAVSHAALGTYLILEGGDEPFSQERLAEMRTLRERVTTAATALADRGFSPRQLERQQKILEQVSAVLSDVLNRQRYPAAERVAFARKLAPPVLANAADAARAQIDGYEAQIAKWRPQLSAEEWQKLKVVVMGSQMPRKGNLAVQYFACLLHQSGEGQRIVYAEALFDDTRALNLLGTHIQDRGIAIAFFDDPTRMDRDLLCDAAAEYLKTLKFD
jgi:hypothetical protein